MSKPSKAGIEAAMKYHESVEFPCFDIHGNFYKEHEWEEGHKCYRCSTDANKLAAIIDEAAKGLVEALKYYADKRIYDENGAPDMSEVADAALADWRTE